MAVQGGCARHDPLGDPPAPGGWPHARPQAHIQTTGLRTWPSVRSVRGLNLRSTSAISAISHLSMSADHTRCATQPWPARTTAIHPCMVFARIHRSRLDFANAFSRFNPSLGSHNIPGDALLTGLDGNLAALDKQAVQIPQIAFADVMQQCGHIWISKA